MENEASFSPFVYFLLFFFYSFFRFSPYYSLNGNYCTPSSSLFVVLFFLLFFTNQQNIFPWNIMLSQFATVAITKWTTTYQHVSSRSFVCLCSFLSFFVCQEISSYYILASPGEPLHTHKNTYIHSWWTRRRKMWRKHVEGVIHCGSLMQMLTRVEQEGIIAKHSHVI